MGPPKPSPVRPIPLYLALISLVVLQAAVSFSGAYQMEYVGNYDTAYYYAVARNIALGQVNSDTVLWHWLGTPEHVARPPGDYWSPGWPFILGMAMRIAGHTMKSSMWICAILSLALPLLTFRAAYSIRPSIFLAWLAGLVLIPQERLRESNFMPDIALPYQVVTLLGLCLLLSAQEAVRGSRRRWLIAGAVLTIPLWLRGDGFVVCAAAVAAILLDVRFTPRERGTRAGWLLVGSAACLAPFLAYNIWAFGSITPEPRAMVPFMRGFSDLYRFETDPTFAGWWAQGPVELTEQVGDVLLKRASHLAQEVPFPLLALALLGAVAGGRRWLIDPKILPLTLTLGISWLVPAVTAPVIAKNPGRFVQSATPLLCVLAAVGLGVAIHRWRTRGGATVALALAFLVCGSVWFWPISARNPLARAGWKDSYTPIPECLRPEGRPFLEPTDIVLTTDPWQVSAVVGVPTVMIPIDSTEAIRNVVAKYHPRYLFIPDNTQWTMVASNGGRAIPELDLDGRRLEGCTGGTWFELAR
ncbi:MAG TPA: hypothetical protein VFG76_03275 [Candidatus Polarisedimenticolia bacterium]|nr:hypothetical protein [Candidatus Polarisedimenticolia bacterium]